MNEVKKPNKPLMYYYMIVLIVIVLLNAVVSPMIIKSRVKSVDYGTFMTMTEEMKIDKVELDDHEILFADKDGTIYSTGVMNDQDLVNRLHDAGIEFTKEITQENSTFFNLFLWFILPMLIFSLLGQYASKKMMDKIGGGKSAMQFGMGKSNAKIYVKSSEGIKFSDVAGEDEAKENLQELIIYMIH